MIKKRAQASVEFLTTYGWAIMAVIIVIGALSYFDLLDAKRFVSEKCDMGSQIQCVEAYVNDAGEFEIALRNNYPVDIIIEKVIVDGVPISNSEVAIGTGGSSNFVCSSANAVCLGLQSKGSKEEYNVLITFKRDAPGVLNSYNITGAAILKVQDARNVPLPDYAGCGDSIVQAPEECDPSGLTTTCAALAGHYQNPSQQVMCNGNCQWSDSVCIEIVGAHCPNNLVETDLGEECDPLSSQITCGDLGALADPPIVYSNPGEVIDCDSDCHWRDNKCERRR